MVYVALESNNTRFYMPNFLNCFWRKRFKNSQNPTHITIKLFYNLWKHGTDFKYLLEEYINKSLLVSAHVTRMLFAPMLPTGLWLESFWLLLFQQLCWSHVWLPDEIATNSLTYSFALLQINWFLSNKK